MPTLRLFAFASCFALALAAPARTQGQAWELLGVVRNPDGTIIEGATVAISGNSTRTDSVGFFRLVASRRDTITIAVRRMGYNPISALLTDKELTGDTLLIVLDPSAQQLAQMTVKPRDLRSAFGFGSFEERRARGNGVFVTQADIEKRNAGRLSDVMRNKRGVQVMPNGRGGGMVRFVNYQSRNMQGRNCAPLIWLDGVKAPGMEIDEIPPNTVAGVELYSNIATTPAQFSAGQVDRPCGTIVIWTREPGSKPASKP
jgi:hypothetical protein